MGSLLTLDDLQKHFDSARDKLTLDRTEIIASSPLPTDFNRDSYGFSYLRAERIGLEVINHSLSEIAWLPMRLDPHAEIISENRAAMKGWLGEAARGQPDAKDFGNDFIHALTRSAILHGWDSEEFRATAMRIGDLFHDLSCLIGLIYYGIWMSENGIEGLVVTDPADLERTAQEIALLTRSPEVHALLKRRKETERTRRAEKDKEARKARAALRIVTPEENPHTLH
jgi:hypothetical protein